MRVHRPIHSGAPRVAFCAVIRGRPGRCGRRRPRDPGRAPAAARPRAPVVAAGGEDHPSRRWWAGPAGSAAMPSRAATSAAARSSGSPDRRARSVSRASWRSRRAGRPGRRSRPSSTRSSPASSASRLGPGAATWAATYQASTSSGRSGGGPVGGGHVAGAASPAPGCGRRPRTARRPPPARRPWPRPRSARPWRGRRGGAAPARRPPPTAPGQQPGRRVDLGQREAHRLLDDPGHDPHRHARPPAGRGAGGPPGRRPPRPQPAAPRTGRRRDPGRRRHVERAAVGPVDHLVPAVPAGVAVVDVGGRGDAVALGADAGERVVGDDGGGQRPLVQAAPAAGLAGVDRSRHGVPTGPTTTPAPRRPPPRPRQHPVPGDPPAQLRPGHDPGRHHPQPRPPGPRGDQGEAEPPGPQPGQGDLAAHTSQLRRCAAKSPPPPPAGPSSTATAPRYTGWPSSPPTRPPANDTPAGSQPARSAATPPR